MLNLDAIINKSYKMQIGGEIINVNQVSVKMVREFNATITGEEEVDIFTVQIDFVLKILNNNTSAKKFSRADIEKLPTEALNAIIDVVANGVREDEKNPN